MNLQFNLRNFNATEGTCLFPPQFFLSFFPFSRIYHSLDSALLPKPFFSEALLTWVCHLKGVSVQPLR